MFQNKFWKLLLCNFGNNVSIFSFKQIYVYIYIFLYIYIYIFIFIFIFIHVSYIHVSLFQKTFLYPSLRNNFGFAVFHNFRYHPPPNGHPPKEHCTMGGVGHFSYLGTSRRTDLFVCWTVGFWIQGNFWELEDGDSFWGTFGNKIKMKQNPGLPPPLR